MPFAGAYGVVFLAEEKEPAAEPRRKHAVKVVTLGQASWSVFDNAERLYREIQILRRLQHTNIVNLTALHVER